MVSSPLFDYDRIQRPTLMTIANYSKASDHDIVAQDESNGWATRRTIRRLALS